MNATKVDYSAQDTGGVATNEKPAKHEMSFAFLELKAQFATIWNDLVEAVAAVRANRDTD